MAGKLQVDRIFLHSICKVWFMSQQNGGLAMGNRPQRFIEARLTLEHIVHAGYPEARPGAFNVKGIVPQERDASRAKGEQTAEVSTRNRKEHRLAA